MQYAKEGVALNKDRWTKLQVDWLQHERWVQSGCPKGHTLRVPGYAEVAQDGVAYRFYRHSLVPFLAEAGRFQGTHKELRELLSELLDCAESTTQKMLRDFEGPQDKFKIQWNNLFDIKFIGPLSTSATSLYLRKFEVEMPLRFLAHLRQLDSEGTYDNGLSRFLDNKGKLKKGVVANYIAEGFSRFPTLRRVLKLAYDTKLRNAIAHNEYQILDESRIRGLDGSFSLNLSDFTKHLFALQTIQNAVLWLLSGQDFDERDLIQLRSSGIVSVAWVPKLASNPPELVIFQLGSFFELDPKASWLTEAHFQCDEHSVRTRIGPARELAGKMVAPVPEVLALVQSTGSVLCRVISIMPCIHQHESLPLNGSLYCRTGPEAGLEVPANLSSQG